MIKPGSRKALATDLLHRHEDDNGDAYSAYSSLNEPSVPIQMLASTQSAGQG